MKRYRDVRVITAVMLDDFAKIIQTTIEEYQKNPRWEVEIQYQPTIHVDRHSALILAYEEV